MGLLRVAHLAPVLARGRAEVFLSVAPFDGAPAGLDRLLREVRRVRTHVGNEAVLVETLRDLHRLSGGEAELTARLLLQRRRYERRVGRARADTVVDVRHAPGLRREAPGQAPRIRLAEEQHVLARDEALLQAPRVVVEVASGGETRAAQVGHHGFEHRVVLLQERLQVPVPGRDKGHPFLLAHDEQAHRDALHAAGGQAGRDLLPEQRRDRIAHETVEHTAGLLCVDQIEVDLARRLERAQDGFLCDLVEDHAPDGHLRMQHLHEVPPDRLTLAVLVRRDVQLVDLLERRLELLDHLPLTRRDDVDGFEPVRHVHAELGPRLVFDTRWNLGGRRR